MRLLLFLSCLFPFISLAQPREFAPVGAKWVYETYIYNGFNPWDYTNYMELECVGDTLIQGKLCRHLTSDFVPVYTYEPTHAFMFQEGDSIFALTKLITRKLGPDLLKDTFQLVYDFSLVAGQSYIQFVNYDEYGDTVQRTVFIDSTYSIQLNGVNLRVQDVHYEYFNGFIDTTSYQSYVEYIGTIDFVHNMNYYYWTDIGSSSGPSLNEYITELRCYEDTVIGAYSTGFSSSCYFSNVGLDEQTFATSFHVYPNPLSGNQLYTDENLSIHHTLSMMDIQGRKITQGQFENGTFEIPLSLKSGIYFLRVEDEGLIQTERIIVH